MTRDEHLKWCKQRALEYVERGDMANALASFVSDLRKHGDTARLAAFATLAGMLHVDDCAGMRRFIDGFA